MVKRVFFIRLHFCLFKHFNYFWSVGLQCLQILFLILICQINFTHMNLKLFQDILQLRRVIPFLSQTLQVGMEDLCVLVNSLRRVSIWVNTYKDALQVKIAVFFTLSYILKTLSHFLQTDWTYIWTVRKTKVNKIVLSSEITMGNWLVFSVVQQPRTTDVSFSCIGGFSILIFFLFFNFSLLSSILKNVGYHQKTSK